MGVSSDRTTLKTLALPSCLDIFRCDPWVEFRSGQHHEKCVENVTCLSDRANKTSWNFRTDNTSSRRKDNVRVDRTGSNSVKKLVLS